MCLNHQILEGCHTYKSESICYNEHRGDPEASKNEKENKTRPRRKCEKMKDTHITIHSFMQEDLGLNGVALKVYALIYSFTKAGSDCHASIEYICQRVGASYSAVYRALKSLVAKNYIIRLTNKTDAPNTYEANLDILFRNDRPSDSQDDIPPLSEVHTPSVESTDNNKEDNKGDNNNTNEINIHSLIKEYWKDKPRPVQAFGSKKVVMMTLHQYANLLRAVGVNPTLSYVRLLENRITKGMFPVKDDHYQQIIDWAREDNRITPEGEEILAN